MYENCHIIIYLSYIFLSDKFAYLILHAESKARPPSAPNVVAWVFVVVVVVVVVVIFILLVSYTRICTNRVPLIGALRNVVFSLSK